MTKEQAMIEANFTLYVGYLKLYTQKKLAVESLKDAGMTADEVEEFIQKRLDSIKTLIDKDQF